MQLKNIVRFPVDIRRAKSILASKTKPPIGLPERPIALDLYTDQLLFDCGRHFASLEHYSREIDSPFFVRCSAMMLAAISRKQHGAEMLAEEHATWIPPHGNLPSDALVFRDIASLTGRTMPNEPSIEMLIGRDIPEGLPVMPYPMHPATLRTVSDERLVDLRSQFDRRGILFAGSQKTKYGHAKMERSFGVLSRLHILDIIKNHARATDRVPVVMRDSSTKPIAASNWLDFLAQHRFFVCCPGAAQPMCHNLIESMSVGTIPLIEYGDRVRPALRDDETAICFRGEQGLRDALDRIQAMSDERLDAMAIRVAEFYDRHLCGKAFLRSLRDTPMGEPPLSIVMPFHSENFFRSV